MILLAEAQLRRILAGPMSETLDREQDEWDETWLAATRDVTTRTSEGYRLAPESRTYVESRIG